MNEILQHVMKDKRKRLRINFETDVNLKTPGGEIISATSSDISMNGLFLATNQTLDIGTECEINIVIKASASKLIIVTNGRVKRLEDNGIIGLGIEFVEDIEWWSLFSIYQHYGREKKPHSNVCSTRKK